MTHPAEAFLAPLAQHTVDRRGFLTFAAKGLALAFVLPAAGRIGSAIAAPDAGGARRRLRAHRHRRQHHARVRRRRNGPGREVRPGADPCRGTHGRLGPDHGRPVAGGSGGVVPDGRQQRGARPLRDAAQRRRRGARAAHRGRDGGQGRRGPQQLQSRQREGHARSVRHRVALQRAVDGRGDAARAGRPAPHRPGQVPPDRAAGPARRHPGEDGRQREVRHRRLVSRHGVRGDPALPDPGRHARRDAGQAVGRHRARAVQGLRFARQRSWPARPTRSPSSPATRGSR